MGTKRRMSNSSSYIGAGNSLGIFNRKPKAAFHKIKKLYDVEIAKRKSELALQGKELTEKEKNKIKEIVEKTFLVEKKKNRIIGMIAVMIIVIILSKLHW